MIYNTEEYYKSKIIESNRNMVDDSDLIICYVDMKELKSGAKRAVNYAIKQKKVINLFKDEDMPFYGMTKAEIEIAWEEIKNGLDKYSLK